MRTLAKLALTVAMIVVIVVSFTTDPARFGGALLGATGGMLLRLALVGIFFAGFWTIWVRQD